MKKFRWCRTIRLLLLIGRMPAWSPESAHFISLLRNQKEGPETGPSKKSAIQKWIWGTSGLRLIQALRYPVELIVFWFFYSLSSALLNQKAPFAASVDKATGRKWPGKYSLVSIFCPFLKRIHLFSMKYELIQCGKHKTPESAKEEFALLKLTLVG